MKRTAMPFGLAGVGTLLVLGACLSSNGNRSDESASAQMASALGGSDGGTPSCSPTAPCSVWSLGATPAGRSSATAVELGVKVQSSESGYITGIRFYKDDTSNPTHTVNLWDRSGNLLATATSTGESTSGWQTVSFAQAVAIQANTTYVASYFMPGGAFPVDRPGLSSAVVNAPLTALADGQDGGNGVYAYGSSSSFPTTSYSSSNYWVDVTFSTIAPVACTTAAPCSIWSLGTAPKGQGSTTSVELGVKLQSNEPGYITGVRFFKDDTNNSTHTVSLWTSSGTLLATATTSGETISGWQSATFSQPVAVSANTTYVASYHMPGGTFALDRPGLSSAVVNSPLTALADGQSGANGLYTYGSTSVFPKNGYNASNYWVDVTFSATAPRTCTVSSPCGLWTTAATPGTTSSSASAELGVKVQSTEPGYVLGVRFYKDDANATHTVNLWDSAGNNLATAQTSSETTSGWQTATFAAPVAVSANKTYVASYFMAGGNFPLDKQAFTYGLVNAPLEALADGQDGAGNGVYGYGSASRFPNVSVNASNYWVDLLFSAAPRDCSPSSPCSIWSTSTTPSATGSTTSVELGVKFQSTEAGYIDGIQFYKSDGVGTHTVNLWDRSGNNLATTTTTNESGSGWQSAAFSQPVAIAANTTYVASFHMPGGAFAVDRPAFSTTVLNAPLQALADGKDGANGVYAYGSSSSFPVNGFNASNYWVDVLFSVTSNQSGNDGGVGDSGGGGDAGDGGAGGGGIDAAITNATAVAAGGAHTCALLSDGTVACWGDNQYGELGNGTTTNSSTAVAVSGLSGVTALAAGSNHTCALISGGTVECWGMNQLGQLGNGTTTQENAPVPVPGLSGVNAISAGTDQTCALLTAGTVECWGGNAYGELGGGTSTGPSTCATSNACSMSPVAVPSLSGATSISAGAGPQTCASMSDGTLQCWGFNAYGELGDGTCTGPATCGGFPCSTSPVAVSGLTGTSAVSAGDLGTCALISGGTVQCWGDNTYGQLGTGSTAGSTFCNGGAPASTTPVVVAGLSGVSALAAGYGSVCALLSGGTVDCWGYNANGQLGNGSTSNSPSPVAVSGLSGVTSISGLFEHACAVLSGGTVECWGYNHWGQLGNGSTSDSSTPVLVGF